MPSSLKYPFAWARYSGAWYGVACLHLGQYNWLDSIDEDKPDQLVKNVILSVDILGDRAKSYVG